MKKVLILGGTGEIGSAVTNELVQNGHRVTALSRSDASAKALSELGAKVIQGDLRNPSEWVENIQQVDVVIQAAATFEDDMAQVDTDLVHAIIREAATRSQALRMIYTGGVWLYGETGDNIATEQTPLRPISAFAFMEQNSRLLLQAPHLSTAIIHPAIVYHQGGGAFSDIFEAARNEGNVEVWGRETVRWPLVHKSDLAVAYRLLVENANHKGHFNASAELGVPTHEIIGEIAKLRGRPLETVQRTLREVVEEYGDWAEGPTLDQQMSSDRLVHELGWAPRFRDFRQSGLSLELSG